MNIQEQTKYTTRAGTKAEVTKHIPGQEFCYFGVVQGRRGGWMPYSWSEDGRIKASGESSCWDLISEGWPRPKPPVFSFQLPPWIKWVAMSRSRYWTGFSEKPYIMTDINFWNGYGRFHIPKEFNTAWKGDWRDSLFSVEDLKQGSTH